MHPDPAGSPATSPAVGSAPGVRRLHVRAATATDAGAVRAIYAPVVEHTAVSFEQETPTEAQMRARIGAGSLPWLVAELAGEVVGYAYAGPHRTRAAYRWSVETSVYVADAARGEGVGRRLYERLLATLADLGHVSAYAGIVLPNPASVALHEAVGFRHVGRFPRVGHKHDRWYDTGWWWRPLVDPEPRSPAEPRPWDGSLVAGGS